MTAAPLITAGVFGIVIAGWIVLRLVSSICGLLMGRETDEETSKVGK